MWKILDRLARLHGWNRRVMGEDDFDLICEQEGVHVLSLDIDWPGLYTLIDGLPVIILNPNVVPRSRPWVYGHELGHHLLHYGSSCAFTYGGKEKAERQADLIASCALIPKHLLESTSLDEIRDTYRYPIELCEMRARFYKELCI